MDIKRISLSFIALAILIAIPFSFTAYKRNTIWRDDFTMWTDTAYKSAAKARAYYNLGAAYHDEKEALEQAIIYYNKALSIEPNYAGIHNDLGDALRDKGMLESAIAEYHTALRLKPDYPKAHNNLGVVYYRQGNFDEAIREFRMALRLNPEYADARNNLEDIYKMEGLK
ncbi:MAG: tetratricopeptide repeat protein [Deltaproteobacteria bacterium]|nr:tetratricopeptide repeat protein [Deltaproteobacteria bacterium]